MPTELFKKGRAKTGGRVKGTPNKVKALNYMQLFEKACAELQFDPITTVMEIAADPQAERSIRLQAAKTLMEFAFPKPRSVEMQVDKTIRVEIANPNVLEEEDGAHIIESAEFKRLGSD